LKPTKPDSSAASTPAQAPRLLIISHDVVGATMAGPGIRYYHLARVLSRHVPTTLAIPLEDGHAANDPGRPDPGAHTDPFAVTHYRRRQWDTLEAAVAAADVILLPSDVAGELSQLASARACLVIDGYDPLMAEWLALGRRARLDATSLDATSPAATSPDATLPDAAPTPSVAAHWRAYWTERMRALSRQYQIGDFFICASERQRDWWLGLLEAHGRINPATFDADPSLRRLVDVVPYGLPAGPLPQPKPVIQGIWEGIAPGDQLALWGGGLWPWLDPLTAIRAVATLRARHPRLKLVFPGTRHPNPAMQGMPDQVDAAKALAAELGVLDTAVFFGDWVPYADWAHVLQESAVALTLHFDTVETRLAFRSRVLEYIWAGLPIVATTGDATSDLVARYGLGEVTPVGDVAAVTGALDRLLAGPRAEQAGAFAAAREALRWEQAAAPLVSFCRNPQRAPDREGEWAGTTPYYDPTRELRAEHAWLAGERDYWRTVAEGYAGGRLMRALDWAGGATRRLLRK
jgi:glycosyltransferase involved in cell wall biosynthesis